MRTPANWERSISWWKQIKRKFFRKTFFDNACISVPTGRLTPQAFWKWFCSAKRKHAAQSFFPSWTVRLLSRQNINFLQLVATTSKNLVISTMLFDLLCNSVEGNCWMYYCAFMSKMPLHVTANQRFFVFNQDRIPYSVTSGTSLPQVKFSSLFALHIRWLNKHD